MLDQAERFRLLRYLRLFCTIGFLPLEVDVNTCEIHPCFQPRWKRRLCQVSFTICCSHQVCTILRLLNVLMFARGTPMYQIVIHIILTSIYAVISLMYYLSYVKEPDINAAVFRMTLTGCIAGRKRSVNHLLFPQSSKSLNNLPHFQAVASH